MERPVHFDVAIVGASLSGCTAAILLSRVGARVALIEKRPDPKAFKRICGHYIQPSAVPTVERLGLYQPILEAGGLRSRNHTWTRWGWIEPSVKQAAYGLNLRRELLDPMIREMAAGEPGVELMLGKRADRLIARRDGTGVVVCDRDGGEQEIRARLTLGADGRDSRVAKMAGLDKKTFPHGRLFYGAYFEGPRTRFWPDGTIWFLDPDLAAAFPTDGDQIFYAAMPTKDRAPAFKADPERALVEYVAGVPDAPPIRESRLAAPVIGKIEMPNRMRGPVAPGLALVGDAALASDPIFGVGCGWAFQSGRWLADSVSPALQGLESMESGLSRYRRRYRRELGMHALQIHRFSNGRKLNAFERVSLSTAARDLQGAAIFEAVGARWMRPHESLLPIARRILATNAGRLAGRGQARRRARL